MAACSYINPIKISCSALNWHWSISDQQRLVYTPEDLFYLPHAAAKFLVFLGRHETIFWCDIKLLMLPDICFDSCSVSSLIIFIMVHSSFSLHFFFAYASEREWCNTQVDKSFSPSRNSPLYLHFPSFTIWLFFLLLNNRTFMFQMQMPLEYSISNIFRLPWEKISLQHTSIQQVIWLCIKRAPLVLEKTFKNHIMSISCLPLLYLDAFPLKLLIMLRGATFAT